MGATDKTYDVVVVGGGPGGYTAAVRARQLGLRTALVALICEDTERSAAELDAAGDLTQLVASSPSAHCLLRRALAGWLRGL